LRIFQQSPTVVSKHRVLTRLKGKDIIILDLLREITEKEVQDTSCWGSVGVPPD
jgi:hypothetical protein